MLSDTVGFIRDLPHTLVQAFHSTLEEVSQADLLLHVVDAGDEEHDIYIEQVNAVLDELGAGDIPVITVFNKIDLTGGGSRCEQNEEGRLESIWLSAHSGDGVELLLDAIQRQIGRLNRVYAFYIPVTAANVRAFLYRHANVLDEDCDQDGAWVVRAEISDSELGRLLSFHSFDECSVVADQQAPVQLAG